MCYVFIFIITLVCLCLLHVKFFPSIRHLVIFFLIPNSDPADFCNIFQGRARQLYNAGYKSLMHLANANPEVLIRTVDHLSRRQAKQIVSSAKVSEQTIFFSPFMLSLYTLDIKAKAFNYRHKSVYSQYVDKIVHLLRYKAC